MDHFTFFHSSLSQRERRKEGEEGVSGAKVCNPKPAIDLLPFFLMTGETVYLSNMRIVLQSKIKFCISC